MAPKGPKSSPKPPVRPEKPKAADSPESDQEKSGLLDMDQAIERLKTTRPTFYRWLRSGKLRGMKVGRQWRFYRHEIDRFLKG